MSYTITVIVVNTTSTALSIVEKASWHYGGGGTWSEHDGGSQHTLTMGSSGTSGSLRFQSANGEFFNVVVGVHNYAPWGDVQVDLVGHDTAVKLLPEYYSGGRLSGEAHRDIKRTSAHGTNVRVLFDAVPALEHKLFAVVQVY
ncbi:fungal fruit body lectin [Aspergillus pseudoustus]|uniref:Fungal fruit body lectin n=1 Tax=Aspergillus pseudoustus TaxID=1810923 RepID=A0ABR4ILE6_9EURO